jgi:ferredoxin
MPFVVTESCIQCKYTDCVAVCPMDCFFEGPNFLAINPDECIDCSVCVPECPVGAIVGANELAPDQQHFAALNTTLASTPGWTRITRQKEPLPEHQQWANVKDKLHLLQR